MEEKDLSTQWKDEGYREGLEAGFKLAMKLIKDSTTEHLDTFDSIYSLIKWKC